MGMLKKVNLVSDKLDAPNQSLPIPCYSFDRWIASANSSTGIKLTPGASYLLSFDVTVESTSRSTLSVVPSVVYSKMNLHFTVNVPQHSMRATVVDLVAKKVGMIDPIQSPRSGNKICIECVKYDVRTSILTPQVLYFPFTSDAKSSSGNSSDQSYRVLVKACVLTYR